MRRGRSGQSPRAVIANRRLPASIPHRWCSVEGVRPDDAEPSLAALSRFFATSPAARRAVRPLAAGARVALDLDEGPAGFTMEAGRPRLAAGRLADPDFTLRLPAAAAARLAALPGDDVGAVGIEFFKLLLERDAALRVGLRVDAPAVRLLSHGYLGALALGGARVARWLLARGLANPRAVIERLRRR